MPPMAILGCRQVHWSCVGRYRPYRWLWLGHGAVGLVLSLDALVGFLMGSGGVLGCHQVFESIGAGVKHVMADVPEFAFHVQF